MRFNVPPDLPRTVIIGSRGFLGRHFLTALRQSRPETIGIGREVLDLSAPRIASLKLGEKGYRAAILVGGITGVARCERDVQTSRIVNVEGTIELITQLHREGIKPVFFSSDYVFDGALGGYADTSERNPTTEYGRQKAQVEDALAEICGDNHLVLRLSKVFSLDPKEDSFVSRVAHALMDGREVQAAYDQIFCPTLVDDVIRLSLELIAQGTKGTLNLCSPEPWSRRDLISSLARRLRVTPSLVVSAALSDIDDSTADRPKNTSMIPQRLRELGACEFTPVISCLDRFSQLWTSPSGA